MKICINQPLYFPYGGFFNKILNSDICVIMDDVKYSKGDYFNRNRIKTSRGPIWLTVPVKTSSTSLINEVKIYNESNWARKHLKSIEINYKKADYFPELFPLFDSFYNRVRYGLVSLNMDSIRLVTEYLGIKIKLIFSSSLNIRNSSTQRLVDICMSLNADTYISGSGAKDYIDEDLFNDHGIKLVYQNFKQKIYPQRYGGYEGNLSVIDMLFNIGLSSYKMITGWN